MAMVAWACLVYVVLWFSYTRANAKRLRGDENHKMDGISDDEIAELGDESPRFVYTI
jgi:hypothetical protein